MESKEKQSVRLDLYAAANDDEPIPTEFTKDLGFPIDPRILEIADILGRQAARKFLAQAADEAANDNERNEELTSKRKGKG